MTAYGLPKGLRVAFKTKAIDRHVFSLPIALCCATVGGILRGGSGAEFSTGVCTNFKSPAASLTICNGGVFG